MRMLGTVLSGDDMLRMIAALSAWAVLSAGLAFGQACPTSANSKSLAISAVNELIEKFPTATSEQRIALTQTARADTIMVWHQHGASGLSDTKGGLNVLARCISNGGCRFEKPSAETVSGIYDFINGKRDTMPAEMQALPPAALAWAQEELGCTGASPPSAVQTVAPSGAPAVRPVPVLVPVDEGGAAELVASQTAVRVLHEGCHCGPAGHQAEGCYMLGSMFEQGIEGYEYDYDSAMYYLERACDLGEKSGCSKFGGNLRDWGKTQAEKDRGTEYIGKACDLGHQSSCFNYEAWTGARRNRR